MQFKSRPRNKMAMKKSNFTVVNVTQLSQMLIGFPPKLKIKPVNSLAEEDLPTLNVTKRQDSKYKNNSNLERGFPQRVC